MTSEILEPVNQIADQYAKTGLSFESYELTDFPQSRNSNVEGNSCVCVGMNSTREGSWKAGIQQRKY